MKKKKKTSRQDPVQKSAEGSIKTHDEILSEDCVFIRMPGTTQDTPSWLPTANSLSRLDFKRGNSLAAWRAFRTNMDQGYYPATWVLKWLYSIFLKYEEGNGKCRLEDLFGFRGNRQGLSTIFEVNETRRQNAYIAVMVASLVGFGKGSGEAIKLVANKTFLNPGTVRNIYSQMKKKHPSVLKEIEENYRHNPQYLQEEPFKHFLE